MINDRISTLIDALGVSPNRFSETIHVNSTVVHNIIKGRRSKPSFDVLQKIITVYDDVSADWLLRGEGKLWRKRSDMVRSKAPKSKSLESRIIWLIDTIRSKTPALVETHELQELIETMINENDVQKKKMVKMHERQEEIIATLMKMKRSV